MKIGKVLITVLGIGSALLLVWGFVSFMAHDPIQPDHVAQLNSSALIKTIKGTNDTVKITIQAEGRVRNASLVNLISEVKGDIVKGRHPLKEGQTFRKGEMIFSVSNPEGKYALKAIRSGFIQLMTSIMPDLKIDFTSGYSKWHTFYQKMNEDTDLPTLPEVNNSREKMFLSNRQIYKAYYEIKSKEAQYHKHYFHAPFDGVLMSVSLQEGTQLNPGMAVGIFGKNSEKEIEVSLSRYQAERLKAGTIATIHKQNTEKPILGKVDRVSDFINPSTQSFTCYIKVKDHGNMKDGEYYKVELDGGTITNATSLTSEAIYGEQSVYLLQKNEMLTKKAIELVYYDDEIAVVKGLSIDETVVNQKVNAVEDRKYKAIQ